MQAFWSRGEIGTMPNGSCGGGVSVDSVQADLESTKRVQQRRAASRDAPTGMEEETSSSRVLHRRQRRQALWRRPARACGPVWPVAACEVDAPAAGSGVGAAVGSGGCAAAGLEVRRRVWRCGGGGFWRCGGRLEVAAALLEPISSVAFFSSNELIPAVTAWIWAFWAFHTSPTFMSSMICKKYHKSCPKEAAASSCSRLHS
jgi:hypothetical protein